MTNRRRNTHDRRARLLAADRLAARRHVLPFNMFATTHPEVSEVIGDGCYRAMPHITEE
jgi:hypothetical protein